jgi:cyclohexanecarboxylate-CoA ligase
MPDSLFAARTIWELVAHRASLSPEAPMLVDPAGRRLSFRNFRERAEGVAAGLNALGIGEGTPVTWQLRYRSG